jgi:copper oxidase (laccase) domain-containing protein
VLQATVEAMLSGGAQVDDTTAVIGPAICGRCYEVPADMRADVDRLVPGSGSVSRTGTPSLDLAAGAASMLSALGIASVRRTDLCTMEDPRFYSYRRDGVTGRFAGVVMLADRE